MNLAPLSALLAAPGDMEQFIRAAVILLVVIVSTVVSALGRAKQKPQRPLGGPPAAKPPARSNPLDDEIGEFLRRVSEGREAAAPPAATRPRRPRPPVQAEVVGERPGAGKDVARQVAEHLDSSQFDRQRAQLGGGVAQADEKMDDRLQGVFAHNLGQLQETPDNTSTGAMSPTEPPPLAASLLAMLSRPESIRQAIIVNEVLQRPEGRWK